MGIFNEQVTENILNSYRNDWVKFVDTLRERQVDRIFVEYGPNDKDQPTNPVSLAFLLKEGKTLLRENNFCYFTGQYEERLPGYAVDELLEMLVVIKNIADQRNIPIFEGSYLYEDSWEDDPTWIESFAISDYFEDKTGERTRKVFEGWMEAVTDIPTSNQIIYNFDWLNFVDQRLAEESGLIAPFNGYYTLKISKENLKISLFAQTVPTIQFLLNRKVDMPLRNDEIVLVKETILKRLGPLMEIGYFIKEHE